MPLLVGNSIKLLLIGMLYNLFIQIPLCLPIKKY